MSASLYAGKGFYGTSGNLHTGFSMKAYIYCAMKILFAWNLLGFALNAHAASFDCTKAKSDVEKLICGDTTTSALDEKLQKTYKTALMATDAYGKNELAKEQRNWIKYTRGICQDTTCLRQVYTDRIAVLARNEKIIVNDEVYSYCELPNDDNHIGGGECVNVLPYRDPNARIESFNESLVQSQRGGKIIGCSRLIDQPVGNINSKENFGGYCVFQQANQRQYVEICNDNMSANFEMQPVTSKDRTDKHLINFIYDNCSGL